ncbi:MAG: hypothetical protein AVDCRST_MAG19-3728 [uncultured Thermomicrobiales bacterium]|uniref:Uncharacterized protein n=1 Tax=uncultured Thermomicrobiales bacterium TaxID=1645740 RepID=A0A6J4VLR7_9BACT|nr:MAG: hypothetical protein AVDCRST_MAG19-3728 [uncultured Thermomicrobiales bacterium]
MGDTEYNDRAGTSASGSFAAAVRSPPAAKDPPAADRASGHDLLDP